MSDLVLYPSPAMGEGIDFVRFGGDRYANQNGVPTQGVLTIPAGVRSFSFAIGGAKVTVNGEGDGWGRAVFVNCPCEPGEVWALGGGDPPSGANDLFSQARSPWPSSNGGGPFFYPGVGPDDYGRAGGDAAFLVRRVNPLVPSTWETWAIAGGAGGRYDPGSTGNPPAYSTRGPVSVGGPIPYAGVAPSSLPVLRGGGAGGGLPPGAGGGVAGAPGGSGGSYYPPGYNLGGPAAPSPESFAGFPPIDFDAWEGGVAVWWWREAPAGWRLGHIGFGGTAW